MCDFDDSPYTTAFKGYDYYVSEITETVVEYSSLITNKYDFQNSPQVSAFNGYKSAVPYRSVNLLRCLTTDKYRDAIEALRNTDCPHEKRRIKSELPAITIAGIFDTRCESGIIEHSGFMGIDIDGKDQIKQGIDWEAMKQLTGEKFDCIYYVGLSAGGNGIFAVARIRNPKYHKMHYRALATEISEATGLKVDMACCDVARLRGASHDPAPYYNANPTPYNRVMIPPRKSTKPAIKSSKERNKRNMEEALELICKHKIDITEKYKTGWLRVAVAIYDEFGEEGRKYFHLASSVHAGYNEEDSDRLYDRCESWGEDIRLGTFFHLCKINGIILRKGGMVYDPSIIVTE